MIIINKNFKDNILDKVHKTCPIPTELLFLIENGFSVHKNDCVFFKIKQPIDVDSGSFFDKTEEECIYNELRISDYTENDIASVAISASEMIIHRLQEEVPLKKFEVLIFFDDFDDKIDAIIKFHTLRNEEVPYIDVQNIDEYQQPIYICRTE
ncbi:hypothetical protein R84981_001257 [Carnimonas sp. R-84981]|uniref:hypothetical protein n=1 Tax=Carnimonas bestiolae TaxID=3402172 RepID=UPI003EDBEC4B